MNVDDRLNISMAESSAMRCDDGDRDDKDLEAPPDHDDSKEWFPSTSAATIDHADFLENCPPLEIDPGQRGNECRP